MGNLTAVVMRLGWTALQPHWLAESEKRCMCCRTAVPACVLLGFFARRSREALLRQPGVAAAAICSAERALQATQGLMHTFQTEVTVVVVTRSWPCSAEMDGFNRAVRHRAAVLPRTLRWLDFLPGASRLARPLLDASRQMLAGTLLCKSVSGPSRALPRCAFSSLCRGLPGHFANTSAARAASSYGCSAGSRGVQLCLPAALWGVLLTERFAWYGLTCSGAGWSRLDCCTAEAAISS